MMDETGKNVMGILPDRLGHDHWRGWIDPGEGLHALALGCEKSVTSLGPEGMRAAQVTTFPPEGRDKPVFHFLLCRPTGHVGAFTQIAAGEQQNLIGHFLPPCGLRPWFGHSPRSGTAWPGTRRISHRDTR